MKRVSIVLAFLSMAVSQQAMAATCWSQAATEAAQVKQLDVMMMVSSLRCRRHGVDLVTDYNRFVISRRPVLVSVGKELIKQFGETQRGNAAVMAYDRLGVLMANSFGNGFMGRACEDIRHVIRDAIEARPDRVSLVFLAQRTGINPLLPAPSCTSAIFATPVLTTAALGGRWLKSGRSRSSLLPSRT